MLLPFPENRRPTASPILTWTLLSVTVAISVWQLIVTRNGASAFYGPAEFLGVVPSRFRFTSLVTYSLIHADSSHLLINMFYLLVFGAGVEAAIGRAKFIALYISGGAFGALLQLFVALRIPGLLSPGLPIVGASAACSCLIGLYAVRYYRDRVTFVGLPYKPTVVELVTLFLAIEIGIGIWQVYSGQAQDGVAHWSHIGGFVLGLTCAYVLKLDDSGEAAYWNEDAVSALDNSQPGAAIGRLEQILARDPNNPSARTELARAWLAFGDREQASIHFVDSIRDHLAHNRRRDAALVYQLMRDTLPQYGDDINAPPPSYTSTLIPQLGTSELFLVGAALEEMDAHGPAAEALRAITVRAPDSTEAETALLRVAGLYINSLDRTEEARILLALFVVRYPNSALRARAEEMLRSVEPAP